MPDPIKVDFRRPRAKARPTPTPAPQRRPMRPGEPAVNWRAVPRFLLIVAPILLALAALQWLIAR